MKSECHCSTFGAGLMEEAIIKVSQYFPVHYPTRDLLRKLGQLKQEVIIFTLTPELFKSNAVQIETCNSCRNKWYMNTTLL